MSDFYSEYKKLNKGQQNAVNSIDGPLLVIAGPGTGKTQLLAMRVANILKSTDTDQYSILCLTFTNKAAVNMKERIISLTNGAGAGVNVRTFHSFAAEIMNSYPDDFWSGANLVVAPEAVQLDIIESIVSELPLESPLAFKFAGNYTMLNDIQSSINLVKDAGLTPEELSEKILSNIGYVESIKAELSEIFSSRLSLNKLQNIAKSAKKLPEQKGKFDFPFISYKQALVENLENAIEKDLEAGSTKNTGVLKRQLVQNIEGTIAPFEELKRNKWWLELATVYKKYRDEMHERGFYDYSDMLVEVISKIKQTPEVLADLQERYLYVLIDEFQDTNPAQLTLSRMVAEHPTDEGKPNIMAVGDDDQSIYKFNGAELSNMVNFKRQYPAGNLIVLTDNYRSSQDILNAAGKVIDMASSRLVNKFEGLDKELVSKANINKSNIAAEKFSSREEQLSHVAKKISADKKLGLEVAVIARSHDSLIKMASLLQQLDISVRYERQSNILNHEIVNQVYLLISLLESLQLGDKASANTKIHRIIRHPLWGIAPEVLWNLAKSNFNKPDWVKSSINSTDKNVRDIGSWFLWLARESSRQPLAVTIEHILGLRGSSNFTSPIRSYFLDKEQDFGTYFHGLSAIQLLRSLVSEFSKTGNPSLSDLVRFFEVNKNNKKIIADESPFVSGKEGVQLLTVHKSKGLEFDSVYIIDLIEKNWQPRQNSKRSPLNLPLRPALDDSDDYIRLLYVAITRAKKKLYLSAYTNDHAGSDIPIYPVLLSSFNVVVADVKKGASLTDILESHLHWPDLSKANEKEVLKARLDTYNLSVTDLINFLDLENAGPQYFKEKNLLRLPEAKTPSLSHGTAIHDALEYAQILTNKSDVDLAKIIRRYEESLSLEQLSVAEFQKFLKHGKSMLERLFIDFKYDLVKGARPEQKLKDIAMGDARLSGKLDSINYQNNLVEVIDYKTGKGVTSIHSKAKNLEAKIWRYKIQLCFYQVLLQGSGKLDPKNEYIGKMVFVETDSIKSLVQTYQPSEQEIEDLKELINRVWNKIKTLDMPDTTRYTKDHEGTKQFIDDLASKKT